MNKIIIQALIGNKIVKKHERKYSGKTGIDTFGNHFDKLKTTLDKLKPV